MTVTEFSCLTDDELIRTSRFNNEKNAIVFELTQRFEKSIDDKEKTLVKREKEMIDWAVACVEEHAGGGFHDEISSTLTRALEMNKQQMKEEINSVISLLTDMDGQAANTILAMLSGDAF